MRVSVDESVELRVGVPAGFVEQSTPHDNGGVTVGTLSSIVESTVKLAEQLCCEEAHCSLEDEDTFSWHDASIASCISDGAVDGVVVTAPPAMQATIRLCVLLEPLILLLEVKTEDPSPTNRMLS